MSGPAGRRDGQRRADGRPGDADDDRLTGSVHLWAPNDSEDDHLASARAIDLIGVAAGHPNPNLGGQGCPTRLRGDIPSQGGVRDVTHPEADPTWRTGRSIYLL